MSKCSECGMEADVLDCGHVPGWRVVTPKGEVLKAHLWHSSRAEWRFWAEIALPEGHDGSVNHQGKGEYDTPWLAVAGEASRCRVEVQEILAPGQVPREVEVERALALCIETHGENWRKTAEEDAAVAVRSEREAVLAFTEKTAAALKGVAARVRGLKSPTAETSADAMEYVAWSLEALVEAVKAGKHKESAR